ncbi:hypothetical protein M758_1G185400 [Ceratodon purpureus]|uniref:Uncharacterized protein n=1 Tax=Ceratodon purpureus TaxID=3225 RepID=A0A8T0J9T6_CERPU|nr:hypothetical protein KC19_1G188700 [Ceratodon purpureus]KAG0630531.1 hypothetical protein M758_1G185400 [Ceratodon purpureus]
MSCLRSPNQLQGEDGRPWKSLADRNFTFASITGLVVCVDSVPREHEVCYHL